jgi:Putative zinc-finger
MSEHSHNHPIAGKSGASPSRKLICEEWEALLVDFLDGTLPAGDGNSFQTHRESCAACAEIFGHAGRGREWLNFLRVEPQTPEMLVAKILAQTSGAAARVAVSGELAAASTVALPATPALPFWKRGGMGFAGRQVAQPRLLMTAAMAFFSITLTLNMAGVRLNAIHLADLKPSSLGSNLDKQFHMASARVVRYYDNWRFFYEMEARVRELRHDADLENSAPENKPDQTAPPASPQDGGHKNGGKSQVPNNPNGKEQPHAMLWGEKVEAALRDPLGELQASPIYPALHHEMEQNYSESGVETTDSRAANQTERGIA